MTKTALKCSVPKSIPNTDPAAFAVVAKRSTSASVRYSGAVVVANLRLRPGGSIVEGVGGDKGGRG